MNRNKPFVRKALTLVLAASTLLQAACGGDEGRLLGTCDTSHEMRQFINRYEAFLEYMKTREGLASESADFGSGFALMEKDLESSLSESFKKDVFRAACARPVRIDSFRSRTPTPEDVEMCVDRYGDFLYDDYQTFRRNIFYEIVRYSVEEVRRLADEELTANEEVCVEGPVLRDGKYVQDPCASKRTQQVRKAGYAEAIALADDLGRIYMGTYAESLAIIQRIKSNGVVAYLSAKCAVDRAFARLQGPAVPQGPGNSQGLGISDELEGRPESLGLGTPAGGGSSSGSSGEAAI